MRWSWDVSISCVIQKQTFFLASRVTNSRYIHERSLLLEPLVALKDIMSFYFCVFFSAFYFSLEDYWRVCWLFHWGLEYRCLIFWQSLYSNLMVISFTSKDVHMSNLDSLLSETVNFLLVVFNMPMLSSVLLFV